MKGNDLSNVIVPVVILVFEGSLGFIEEQLGEFNELASLGEWEIAWSCWDYYDLMARKIWDVVTRKSLRIEIVTYIGDGSDACREGLQACLDDRNIPAIVTVAHDAQTMARELSFRPDVIRIYDANQETAFAYGSKGVYLRNVHMLGEL